MIVDRLRREPDGELLSLVAFDVPSVHITEPARAELWNEMHTQDRLFRLERCVLVVRRAELFQVLDGEFSESPFLL